MILISKYVFKKNISLHNGERLMIYIFYMKKIFFFNFLEIKKLPNFFKF